VTAPAIARVVPPPPAQALNPSLTPQNDAEREAVRMVLEELRKKKSESASAPSNVARVTVKLPTEARLFIDNSRCPLTSGTRTFNTPTLEPGRQYFYTLRMEVDRDGQTVTENRRVILAAGQRVEVDFNTPVTAAQR
jgi:uncharacterized protein (TIGR03000 family)